MTLGPHLGRLVSIASPPLAQGPVEGLPASRLGSELAELLTRCNGFIAFESALVLRGAGSAAGDLAAWNAKDGWRASYSGPANGVFFFAEDTFGGQFGMCAETVVSFDPETGDRKLVASSLEDWAQQILTHFELMTGYPLARDWQHRFGPLPSGKRLIPKIPFVLGGILLSTIFTR